jgi:hypothetical protein
MDAVVVSPFENEVWAEAEVMRAMYPVIALNASNRKIRSRRIVNTLLEI